MQALVDKLNEINGAADNAITALDAFLQSNDSSLEIKSNVICQLTDLLQNMKKNQDKITSLVDQKKREVQEEIAKKQEEINSIQRKLNGSSEKKKNWSEMAEEAIQKPLQVVVKNAATQKRFKVAEGVFLDAYEVNDRSDAKKYKGFLCFETKYKKFCMSINGVVVAGLALDILDQNEKQSRIIENYNAENPNREILAKDRDFYIRPELGRGNFGPRNLTNRLLYLSASKQLNGDMRGCFYRMGSARDLRSDIATINEKDMRLYEDMAFSYFICLLAAKVGKFDNL